MGDLKVRKEGGDEQGRSPERGKKTAKQLLAVNNIITSLRGFKGGATAATSSGE